MGNETDDGIREAARVIRAYLPTLVGPAAADVDRQVAELLAADDRSPESAARLRLLLSRDEATDAFLAEILADAPNFRPPDMQPGYLTPTARGLGKWEALPGDPGVIMHAGVYVCPEGDYTWYRPAVGVPVPSCPSHGPLVKG